MIKILKQAPITFNDVDCIELLVENDCLFEPCSHCCYRHYVPSDSSFECCAVHGCSRSQNTYFIIA